jgi:hypothetical protein
MEEVNVDIPKFSPAKNCILTADFTEKEMLEAISQMDRNNVPGSDGFLIELYQKFWDVVKIDFDGNVYLVAVWRIAYVKTETWCHHFASKKEYARSIEKYGHICLLNISFKFFLEVGTNRVMGIVEEVVQPTKTAFFCKGETFSKE